MSEWIQHVTSSHKHELYRQIELNVSNYAINKDSPYLGRCRLCVGYSEGWENISIRYHIEIDFVLFYVQCDSCGVASLPIRVSEVELANNYGIFIENLKYHKINGNKKELLTERNYAVKFKPYISEAVSIWKKFSEYEGIFVSLYEYCSPARCPLCGRSDQLCIVEYNDGLFAVECDRCHVSGFRGAGLRGADAVRRWDQFGENFSPPDRHPDYMRIGFMDRSWKAMSRYCRHEKPAPFRDGLSRRKCG